MLAAMRIGKMSKQTCLVWLSVICGPALAMAADPMAIQSGRVLFTQAFTPTTPSPNGDGLGPLFNHVSCVACHHSGGVGGAGDNRFNARSLAIDQVRFAPLNRGHGVAGTLASLNPLLVTNSQQLRNSIPLPRFGGSPAFAKFRDALINPFNADWETAEFANSETVRREATEKVFHDSTNSLAITARIQSRNTTSLFGAGLIDRVPDSVILQAAKSKKRFPEIKGRPATLAFGKIGKFGWRANFATLLEFNENACVNELGLQSKSVPQPADPTRASLEWRTPPLWGLRDSAPYLHDGRAETILEAISMHDGEAMATRNRFFALSYSDQMAMLAFLESLVAPTQGVIPAPKDFEPNAFAVKLP